VVTLTARESKNELLQRAFLVIFIKKLVLSCFYFL